MVNFEQQLVLQNNQVSVLVVPLFVVKSVSITLLFYMIARSRAEITRGDHGFERLFKKTLKMQTGLGLMSIIITLSTFTPLEKMSVFLINIYLQKC